MKVVSSPNILASNNKEAKIQVGSSEPIPTGVFTSTTATVGNNSGIVETSVEYKDIGTIVTVTPRISDGGLVTMEISIEDSALGPIQQVGNLNNVRSFVKRTAKTVVSIVEGQTLVMGGLIRDEKTRNTTGVPFLSKIPIIGFLFGNKTRLDRKTELVLLLTPHVITDQAQSNAVTKEFKEKIQGLREEIEMKKK